jgi:hypothetical protein
MTATRLGERMSWLGGELGSRLTAALARNFHPRISVCLDEPNRLPRDVALILLDNVV